MTNLKPRPKWATRFSSYFQALVSPRAVGGACRKLEVRPRGKPKLSVHDVLMIMTGQAMAHAGDLATHARKLKGKRISNAALSKRRQRLPWEIFEAMLGWVLGPLAEVEKHPSAFWRGYRLVGVDGTMFSAKNCPGILRCLSKAISRRMEAAFAKLRVVVLVELGTHHPMAAVIGTDKEGEITLGRRLIEKVPPKSLLLGDRLFGVGKFLLPFLQQWVSTERDFLVRVCSFLKAEILECYPDGSALAEVTAYEGRKAREILVRQIHGRVRSRDGRTHDIRLWTSLLDPKAFPAAELLRLYALRWEQEIAFHELKVQLRGGALLRSQTLETAMQEIAALLVAQAIVARIRVDAGQLLQGQTLRISFAQVLQHVQVFWDVCQCLETPESIQRAAVRMMKLLVERASPPRRNRTCPRAVRKPLDSWPRLLENQSLQGEILCEIMPHQVSKG